MQFCGILQDFFCCLLNIRLLLQDVPQIILINVDTIETRERLHLFQLDVSFTVIHIQWRNLMMLRITRHTDCKYLLELAILRNELRIMKCSVQSIIPNGLNISHFDYAAVGKLHMLIHISLILNDQNKITIFCMYHCCIFRIPCLPSTLLGCRRECIIDFFDIAPLSGKINLALTKLTSNP